MDLIIFQLLLRRCAQKMLIISSINLQMKDTSSTPLNRACDNAITEQINDVGTSKDTIQQPSRQLNANDACMPVCFHHFPLLSIYMIRYSKFVAFQTGKTFETIQTGKFWKKSIMCSYKLDTTKTPADVSDFFASLKQKFEILHF